MKFSVEEAEYVGLLRIKSVVEAALRSRDQWTSEVGYAKMFELIQHEIEAYYTATGQPVPDFYLKTLNERYDGVKFSVPAKEQGE
jgi:hypothetical protein